jgi:predicted ATPase
MRPACNRTIDMLTELHIKNFKAWRDTGPIRLAPLTVIFGANSSGKSSLGHLLLALKQTVQLADRKRALHLGDENSLIDLGTFADCLYAHDLTQPLEFSLRWRLSSALTVKNALDASQSYRGDELWLSSTLRTDKAEQPQTAAFNYRLFDGKTQVLEVEHSRGTSSSQTILDCSPLKLVRAQGRAWSVEPPEKFYRFADRTLLRYQNADFLADFALRTEQVLEQLYFLGPLRRPARRVYQWSGDTVPDVGAQGEYAIPAILAATAQDRRLNRGYRQLTKRFDEFIARWLTDLGIIHSFTVRQVAEGRKEYEVLVKTHRDACEVRLTDVGFGVSQVLPALVQAFYAPPGSTVWMEQPEIHLHPMAQSNLADVFISAIKSYEASSPRNMQLIIETHSEHLLTRLQRRVAEQEISAEEVAIYFVNRKGAAADIEAMRLNLFGEIENWPENFFGDEMGDIAARTLAALERQATADGQDS